MFDLTSIASKVARFDEKGEKRALRKSYKGHMKTLKIDGHFEPVKKEPTDPDHLLYQLCDVPEQEYYVHFVQGKEVEGGLGQDVLDKLDAACTMNKGNISSEWNTSVLGDLAPGKLGGLKGRETAPGTPAMGGTPGGAVGRPGARRKRAYADDDGMETGYSTAEERAPAEKRRKKVHIPGRQGYGPGMVGA